MSCILLGRYGCIGTEAVQFHLGIRYLSNGLSFAAKAKRMKPAVHLELGWFHETVMYAREENLYQAWKFTT